MGLVEGAPRRLRRTADRHHTWLHRSNLRTISQSDEPTVDLDKDDEIIALLAERWPCWRKTVACRSRSVHDLKAALGGKVSPDQLSRALGTVPAPWASPENAHIA
jgi:hypothetical protein